MGVTVGPEPLGIVRAIEQQESDVADGGVS
jgi:hypothetical protein